MQDQAREGLGASLLPKELIDRVNEAPPSWQVAAASPSPALNEAQESPRGSSMELTGMSMDLLRSSLTGSIGKSAANRLTNSPRQSPASRPAGKLADPNFPFLWLLQSLQEGIAPCARVSNRAS